MKRKLLICGAGPTGTNLASNLSTSLSSVYSQITVWEKSSSPGRFAVNTPRGAAASGGAICDLGAQYFTAYDTRTNQYLSSLQLRGKVAKLGQNTIIGARGFDEHPQYVSISGSASIVNDSLDQASLLGVKVQKNKRLVALNAIPSVTESGPDQSTCKSVWRATDEDGNDSIFDDVALTIPAPQVLQLKGNVSNVLENSGVGKALKSVAYSTRLVLALYFPESAQALFEEKVPWFGRFVNRDEPGGDVIRYLSFESRKRYIGREGIQGESKHFCPSFISHSTVEYGAAHENDEDYKKALEGVLVQSTLKSLAKAIGLRESDLPSPIETRVHRWKYSQVSRAIAIEKFEFTTVLGADGGDGHGEKDSAALLIQNSPLQVEVEEGKLETLPSPPLVLAGDYFTSSNLAGCLKSADAVLTGLASTV